MATFNQQGQTVQYQYNADTINFGQVKTPDDFLLELKNLQTELGRAIDAKALTGESAIDADTHIKKAILHAEADTPDKSSLVEHLISAQALVTNVDGLVVALSSAITTIGALF